ncbi:MAG: amidohydrolase [Clostridia bacterium]|nr:amidohydrolase [Clostridia bacterium]
MQELLKKIQNDFEEMKENYFYLHRNAETGFDLPKTSAFVIKKLKEYGCAAQICGNNGVIAEVGDKGKGKTILLRADMDALPIKEESGVPYACENGNMHACGHDMHTVMLLECAKLLKSRELELKGCARLLFQPAEERLEGAKSMIDGGVLRDPVPSAALMIHVMTGVDIESGKVIVTGGGTSAPSADYFRIKVKGKGTHGASASNGIDPITALSHIVIALQEIQAREIRTGERAALTVGRFSAGNAGNVIPEYAEAEGSLRCFDGDTRRFIKRRLTEISESIGKAFRADVDTEFYAGCPPLVNDEQLSALCRVCLTELLGERSVIAPAEAEGRSMSAGSEDFAYIAERVPSVMLAVSAGSRNEGYEYPLHNPKARFDLEALRTGAASYAYVALKYLS